MSDTEEDSIFDDFEMDSDVADVVENVMDRDGEWIRYMDYSIPPLRRSRARSGSEERDAGDVVFMGFERNVFTPPISAADPITADDGEIEEFNRDLPAQHSYLGDNMEIVPGRAILDEYSIYNLPLLAHHSMIFPGQTLPMMPHSSVADRLFHITEGGQIFGLVCPDVSGSKMFRYGVTCEVYEKETQNSGTIKVKAKGRQRFKVLGPMRTLRDYVSIIYQHVLILPEISLGDPLTSVKLLSLDKHRNGIDNDKLKKSIRRSDAIQTRWPAFVFNLYDDKAVIKKIRAYFKQFKIEYLPSEPIALSFWVAHNLQLDASKRLQLFQINSALRRLQLELEYMEQSNNLKCKNCNRPMANVADLFAMSNDGIQSHYCNPDGWIHETFTVLHTTGASLHGQSSNEASWFPGYAWTIALCKGCRQHVGWLFTANKRSLRPPKFWGLCRASITSLFTLADVGEHDRTENITLNE